jgi:hypothetical protein
MTARGVFMALALVAACPVAAQTPMTVAEFEAFVTGRTLVYGSSAGVYGIEEYFPGRSVRWAYLGEPCIEGYWYPQNDAICFIYENRDTPQCWYFYLDDGNLTANTVENPVPEPLYVINESREVMHCPGPRVGV